MPHRLPLCLTPAAGVAAVSPGPASRPRLMRAAEGPVVCLTCEAERGHRARLKDVGLITHGGGIRCGRCQTVHWVLVQAGAAAVFWTVTSAHELADWRRRGWLAADVIDAIGARDLVDVVLGPVRRAA